MLLYYDQLLLSLVPQLFMNPDYYIIIIIIIVDMIIIIVIITRNWYVITGMAIASSV